MRSTQKNKSKEIGAAEKCPCGSGKRYSICCKRRDFKWVRHRNGDLSKSVQIPTVAIDLMNGVRDEFVAVFGREPRRSDPLFITRFDWSDADVRRETLRAMRAANINPALIYAYQKTDRIVSNPKLLSAAEQDEYEAAVAEFYAKQKSFKVPVSELIDPETPERFMSERQKQIQIIIGYVIEKHFNHTKRIKCPHRVKEVEFVVGFATLILCDACGRF